MSKTFTSITKVMERSVLHRLQKKATEQSHALEIIRHSLANLPQTQQIKAQGIMACEVGKNQLILICQHASHATLLQQAMLLILPELKKQYPKVFPQTITKIKVQLSQTLSE